MAKIPLYYTFGNHMHWVDMQWLWGYHVLPGSIRDMLHFCRETGARGNVNFDGIGYEKLAAEDPEALAELREAVQAGIIEPVGCSYGQPYGLFHGGESNIRQRIYGARTVRRLLGVWPKTFWEEEFDFFPQLPQMLRGCGFEYASLFFQWTWHTPEIPKEDVPVVWWEGQDGSRLLCATRNKLNLHQWPEDMDATFAELADSPPLPTSSAPPLLLQWLELMPSPDWMCRSELLLPKMRELLADDRFEIKMATLGEYLRGIDRGMGVPPMVSSDVPSELQPKQSTDSSPELETRQGAYLPHWTKDGAIYAVTFRLDDALPTHIQQQYAEERDVLQKMHDEGRLKSTALAYELMRLRTEKVENALDAGYGSCLLKDSRCAEAVAGALKHFDGERYDVLAYAVMPNHVHAVLTPLQGHDLASILHSWKSFTAHSINKLLGRTGTVWQPEYYDHLIRGEQDLTNQIRYVLMNPESAGMPELPWVYKREAPITPDHDRDGHGNHGRDAHATIPVRKYSMDDVWHGMSLGKNADRAPRQSHLAERNLLSSESLQAVLGLFGRPYDNWDVYPTWELEEGWRNLLAAQHHDNHECEGLCGHVAIPQFHAARELSRSGRRGLQHLAAQMVEEGVLAYNPFAWDRPVTVLSTFGTAVVSLPALGYVVVPQDAFKRRSETWQIGEEEAVFVRGSFEVRVTQKGRKQISIRNGMASRVEFELPPVRWRREDQQIEGAAEPNELRVDLKGDGLLIGATECCSVSYRLCVPEHIDALDISVIFRPPIESPIDPGLNSGAHTVWPLPNGSRIIADQPYGISETDPHGTWLRKYPKGDWMTSPQWFESITDPFTSQSLVDVVDSRGAGMLILHNGSQQWFRRDEELLNVVNMTDPWDEDRVEVNARAEYRVILHEGLSNTQRWQLGREVFGLEDRYVGFIAAPTSKGKRNHFPDRFSALSCNTPNVVPSAFYRETEDFSGKHVENYAGKGMGYPFVVRLVEFDGIETETTLTVGGTVAKAYKTNHLGQILLEAPSSILREQGLGSPGGCPEMEEGVGGWRSHVTVKMRPYEIATIYLDIVEGRKQTRDLDAKREIWATVHRVDEA